MKRLNLILILSLVFFLSACSNQSDKEVQLLQNDISNIVDRMDNGILSSEEAFTLSYQLQLRNKEIITKDMQKDFDKLDRIIQDKMRAEKEKKESELILKSSKKILPDWALSLGLSIPANMTLDESQTKETTVSSGGYDSITLVYKGDYDTAMQQAAKIAKTANLPISSEFASLQKKLGSVIKGVVYTNHGLLDTNIEYLVSITVDEDGSITIEATNYKQMNSK